MVLILCMIFLIITGKTCNELTPKTIKTYDVSDFSCKTYLSNNLQSTIEKETIQNGAYKIWYTNEYSSRNEYVTFIKEFNVIGEIISANFTGKADDHLTLIINNQEVPIYGDNYWYTNHNFFITANIQSGINVANMTVLNNAGGPGSLYFKIIIESRVYV